MDKWKCCIKEPSETGKKVLCHRKGDIYVAMRIKNYYVPMPFADHYTSTDLCHPETWCEIDFPEGLTGHVRVGNRGGGEIITLSEAENRKWDIFEDFCKLLISSIGILKRPEKKDD